MKQVKFQKIYQGKDPRDKTITVMEGEVAVTNGDSEHPILTSYGARSCLIVIIYNPETKDGTIAHIYKNTDLSLLEDVFKSIQGNYENNLEVHLGGAVYYDDPDPEHGEESRYNYDRVTAMLDNMGGNDIKTVDIGEGDGRRTVSLGINTETNEVFREVNEEPSIPRTKKVKEELSESHDLRLIIDDRKLEGREGKLYLSLQKELIKEDIISLSGNSLSQDIQKEWDDITELLEMSGDIVAEDKEKLNKEVDDLLEKVGELKPAAVTALERAISDISMK